MKNPLKAAFARALDRRFAELSAQIDRQQAELRDAVAALAAQSAEQQGRVDGALRYLLSEEAENCRRVEAMRASPEYLAPYEDPEPLVSICIPLIEERIDLFLERALPSALAQSHKAIELLVVCDGFDPSSEARLQAVDDPRVRFGWVTQSVINPDQHRHWFSASTLSHIEARRMSTGLWITELDDDDALPADAIELLLANARETRAEVVSGTIEQFAPDGSSTLIAGFPPGMLPAWSGLGADWKARATSAALVHSGLSSIARQRTEDFFEIPGDLMLTIKLARAGVRFAAIEDVVYDYYPGTLWGDDQR